MGILNILRGEGESARIAAEDLPEYIFQKIENLRPFSKIGSWIKRLPYVNRLITGLTSLQTMLEFTTNNNETELIIIDNNGFEGKINNDENYSSDIAFTDERTAGSTIDGANTQLIKYNKEIRGGVGISADTQRPIWYKYVKERIRYSNTTLPVTISADNYLEDQFYKDKLTDFLTQVYGQETSGWKTDHSVEAGKYGVYVTPVYDEYQKGVPQLLSPNTFWGSGGTYFFVEVDDSAEAFIIVIRNNPGNALKRITHFDVFCTENIEGVGSPASQLYPAYFLERISLKTGGDYIFSITGTFQDADPPTYFEIDDFAEWETFRLNSFYMVFTYDSVEYQYRIFTRTEVGTKVHYTVNEAIASALQNVNVEVSIKADWYYIVPDEEYSIVIIFDDFYRKLGSEMFTYLNLPMGELGLEDYQYLYSAWNGNRAIYGGGVDANFSYFSVLNAPDIIPSLNIVKHKTDTIGFESVGQDFLVFTRYGVERIRINSNADAHQDDEYLNAVLVNNKGKFKIDDNTMVFMSYQGPIIISGREVNTRIGWHLREWWLEKFTKAQLEACVVGYNFKEEEIWFSFPTYTTSPYTNGIIFVFDVKGHKEKALSAWWRIKTDIPVIAFEQNLQHNLLGAGSTKIVDFNTIGTDEDVATCFKLKVLENSVNGKKTRFNDLRVDVKSDDVITGECYFDGSESSDLTLSFNADETAFIRYIAKTLEVEITTSGSTNTLEHKRLQLNFKSLRR